jgi:hypothetical protein
MGIGQMECPGANMDGPTKQRKSNENRRGIGEAQTNKPHNKTIKL